MLKNDDYSLDIEDDVSEIKHSGSSSDNIFKEQAIIKEMSTFVQGKIIIAED